MSIVASRGSFDSPLRTHVKKFTKSSSSVESALADVVVTARPATTRESKRAMGPVVESMMGLSSPSQSMKGSFGPKRRTRSRCPNTAVLPGPGHYNNRYHMLCRPWPHVASHGEFV